MATPTVAINSAGSDTAASGAGPATALSGSLAATHANTTANITDAVDLSGVAVDGSAVLWVATSSGRRWSAISAISGSSGAWAVTVGAAYAATQSGASWAIGGKRATIDGSRQLFPDAAPGNVGWTIDVQTGETLTSQLAIGTIAGRGVPLIITSTAVARPLITTATNSINLIDISGASYIVFRHLAFSNTAATKGTTSANGRAIVPMGSAASSIAIDDCTFDGFEVTIDADNVNPFRIAAGLAITRSEIKNSVSDGVRTQFEMVVDRCNIHNNGGDGIQRPAAAANSVTVTNSVFASNGGSGFHDKTTGPLANTTFAFVGNTFRNNTGTDLQVDTTQETLVLADNIFWGTGPYGASIGSTPNVIVAFNNAYGGPHATAERNNVPVGVGDIALTGDPGTSTTDSALNAAAGAGAACKGAAAAAPNATASAAGDVGAIPSGGGASAGVSGMLFVPNCEGT